MDYLTINHFKKDLFINEDECINEYCSFLEFKELLFNEFLKLKQWRETFYTIQNEKNSMKTNFLNLTLLQNKNKNFQPNKNIIFHSTPSLCDIKFTMNQLNYLKSKLQINKKKFKVNIQKK